MSRKHYEAIAKILNGHRQRIRWLPEVVEALTQWFSKDNPEFNADRFKKACGVK